MGPAAFIERSERRDVLAALAPTQLMAQALNGVASMADVRPPAPPRPQVGRRDAARPDAPTPSDRSERFRVTTPSTAFAGERLGIAFGGGVGHTSDAATAAMCGSLGYAVEDRSVARAAGGMFGGGQEGGSA